MKKKNTYHIAIISVGAVSQTTLPSFDDCHVSQLGVFAAVELLTQRGSTVFACLIAAPINNIMTLIKYANDIYPLCVRKISPINLCENTSMHLFGWFGRGENNE